MREMLEPLTRNLAPETARLFANLQATPSMAARLQVLAEKCNEGELSAAEQREYQDYLQVGDLFAILKAQAKKSLAS